MFLCKHVLTAGPDQSPCCCLCLFLKTVIFSVLDSLFDLGLFKAGSGFQMETHDLESAGFFSVSSICLKEYFMESYCTLLGINWWGLGCIYVD